VSWSDLSDWWRTELLDDPAYEADVTPLILDLLNASAGERVLDVGCGEGRLMATLADVGARPFGVDISQDLLETARTFGPVVRQSLPQLSVFRNGVVDAAVVSLVLEHLEDEETLLAELGRVVRPGGRLAIVVNHPVFTAPDSAPIQESDEVLWRPGRYFRAGLHRREGGEGHRSIPPSDDGSTAQFSVALEAGTSSAWWNWGQRTRRSKVIRRWPTNGTSPGCLELSGAGAPEAPPRFGD
jgi:SAM-dependent methyltransferase